MKVRPRDPCWATQWTSVFVAHSNILKYAEELEWVLMAIFLPSEKKATQSIWDSNLKRREPRLHLVEDVGLCEIQLGTSLEKRISVMLAWGLNKISEQYACGGASWILTMVEKKTFSVAQHCTYLKRNIAILGRLCFSIWDGSWPGTEGSSAFE